MIIKIGNDILCDGADRSVNKSAGPAPGWSIAGRLATQVAESLRARNVRVFDRGNEQTTVQFEINRLCSSIAAADLFAALHLATVTRSGVFLITSGANNMRIQAAVVQDVKCTPTGCSVRIAYTVTGGALEMML